MTDNNPKFYNKNGDLTAYSFSCGYIQVVNMGHIKTEMFKDGCWHVKQYDENECERLVWETFSNLTEARKFFNKIKKR